MLKKVCMLLIALALSYTYGMEKAEKMLPYSPKDAKVRLFSEEFRHFPNERDEPNAFDLKIIDAAERGSSYEVECLLNQGAGINVQDKYGATALIKAVKNNHKEIVALLLQRGADHSLTCWRGGRTGDSALMIAIKDGRKTIVKLLLRYGADIKVECDHQTVLYRAACAGLADVVTVLIELGTQVGHNSRFEDTPMLAAARAGHVNVVGLLLNTHAYASLIQSAYSDKERVNANELDTALIDATSREHLDVVKTLLAYGASPTAKLKRKMLANIRMLEGHDVPIITKEYTALKDATERKNKVLECLFRSYKGALGDYLKDPSAYCMDIQRILGCSSYSFFHKFYTYTQGIDSQCMHQTPLMWACIFGQLDILEKILTLPDISNDYINFRDACGYTALDYALLYKEFKAAYKIKRFCQIKGISLDTKVYLLEGELEGAVEDKGDIELVNALTF